MRSERGVSHTITLDGQTASLLLDGPRPCPQGALIVITRELTQSLSGGCHSNYDGQSAGEAHAPSIMVLAKEGAHSGRDQAFCQANPAST